MRDEIFQTGLFPGDRARSSEFLVVALQEGDEDGNQEQVGRLQVTVRRATDRHQRIIRRFSKS
jgi:hypothetical protein